MASPSSQDLVHRLQALEAENERLRREATSAGAAMELAERCQRRQQELEASHREIAAALQRAEEASSQKSRFLANISHELRTPLNGILGMAELLQHSALDARQRDFVQSIATTADSFLDMVNELLDFAKIEAGKIELESVVFDLWEAVEAVAQDLQLRCDGKGLQFSFYLSPDLPRDVRGDPLRLRQMLLNLGANAVKFTDRGNVSLEVVPDDRVGGLRATVRDTGCGIAADVASRLFQPFVQAHASTARNYGGTGLGLAISRQFARCMGGDVTFTSALDVGSQFVLRVPLLVIAGAAAAPVVRRRAVIVARQASTQRMLAEHLPRLGYDIATTADGTVPVDLLVVECLDGEAGIEGLARLRSDGVGSPLLLLLPPRHAISGERFAELGGRGVLMLPLRPSQLAAALLGAGDAGRPEAPSMVDKAHVLVAEDIAVNRKVVEAQLLRLGCQVTCVDNGEAAVLAAMSKTFDLILMDCQMPRMDGPQATAAIRVLEAGRNQRTPVIALTASALPGDREACLAAGMDDYLSKPLRQADLVAMLRRWKLMKP